MRHIISSLFMVLFFSMPVIAEIQEESVSYQVDGQNYQGYLYYDDSSTKKRPGVLVVHEWWGLNDYARKRARMLAELGYTALALDMFGNGKTTEHPAEAGEFSKAALSYFESTKARFLAAMDILKAHSTTNSKIAAIGYCFGGGVVLNMARAGVELDAVASFHGSLEPKVSPLKGAVKAAIYVANGEDDNFIPAEAIETFKADMKRAGANFIFRQFPGAKHAFTNPGADQVAKEYGLPIAYNAQADAQSWQDMQKFFNKYLG